ncbi:polysaccharide deacetylase family protein [Paenibacillus humicola]|uniref:polysaccharide deacetylase family protein n=1 Tax=Paenibacillus humicola TaxID=3110540 RepID=UPI00237C2DC7|nr:polysaccharide deacetylase family protein [Paenibacillus humicola]
MNVYVRQKWLMLLGALIAASMIVFGLFGPHKAASHAVQPPRQRPGSQTRRFLAGEQSPPLSGSDGAVLYNGKIAVLMFHDIEPVSRNNDIITPAQFEGDLDQLRSRNIHFISLRQFRQFMRGGAVPPNAALVTFDDGYESFYKYAYPALKKRGIGGVCFVITGDLSKNARVFTPHMTAAQIRTMTEDDPDIEVQAHTDSLHYKIDSKHDALTGYLVKMGVRESRAAYIRRISNDIKSCISKLMPLNSRPIDTFAYPYGLHSPDAVQTLRKAGIAYAFTTKAGLAARTANPMLLPRLNGGSPKIGPAALYREIVNAALTGSEPLGPRAVPFRTVTGKRPLLKAAPRTDHTDLSHAVPHTVTHTGRWLPALKPHQPSAGLRSKPSFPHQQKAPWNPPQRFLFSLPRPAAGRSPTRLSPPKLGRSQPVSARQCVGLT